MNVAVLLWINKDQNMVMLEANRIDEPAESPPLIVSGKGREIRFRTTCKEEPPEYPGFKLYGIGRYRLVADCGAEEAGTGTCHAVVMTSSQLTVCVRDLVSHQCEVYAGSGELNAAASRTRDPLECDDLLAITREMIESIIGGAK